MKKCTPILIIRLSSFGDIIQSSLAAQHFHKTHPESPVHFLTKKEYTDFVRTIQEVDQVISFDTKNGLYGLWKLSSLLKKNNYQLIYDAHENFRTHLLKIFLRIRGYRNSIIRRKKMRLRRYFFFQWHKRHLFPKHYSGAKSFLTPLGTPSEESIEPCHFETRGELPPQVLSILQKDNLSIAAIACAQWPNKRWPIEYWKSLMDSLPHVSFFIMGGPKDTYLNELLEKPNAVSCLGKLSFDQSIAVLRRCHLVIGNDTGLTHLADHLLKKTIFLMGPTAFGFPTFQNSSFLATNLICQPCSKDGRTRCKNTKRKQCLFDITPEIVKKQCLSLLPSPNEPRPTL